MSVRHATLGDLSNAQVSDFDLACGDEEDVLCLDVAVQNVCTVQALQALADLNEKPPNHVLIHELISARVSLHFRANVTAASELGHDEQFIVFNEGVIVPVDAMC